MHTRKLLLSLFVLPLGVMAQSGSNAPAGSAGTASPQQTQPQAPADGSATAPGDAQAAPDDVSSMQQELSEVTRQITDLQRQAESNEDVQSAKEDYVQVLRTEMVRAAPELESDIDRQTALVAELSEQDDSDSAKAENNQAPAEEPADQQAKLQEYRTLYQKLAPVEQSVQSVPAVQEARTSYYQKLIAEMERLNPNTQDLLERHRELLSAVRARATQQG